MDYSAEKFVSDKCRMDFLKFGSGDRNLIIIPGLNVKSILTMADVIVQGNSIFPKMVLASMSFAEEKMHPIRTPLSRWLPTHFMF